MPTENDKDLNDLLSAQQRIDFTLLVANVSSEMRSQLEKVFTYVPPTDDERKMLQKTEELAISEADVVKEDRTTKATHDEKSSDTSIQETQLVDEQVKVQLQKPALDYFDGWRSALLQRLGEVINTRSATNGEAPTKDSATMGDFPRTEADHKIKFPAGIDSSLSQLSAEYKTLLLNASHSRTLLKKVSESLCVPPTLLLEVEGQVASQLQQAAELQHQQSEEDKAKATASSRWKIGLASVAGAALVGITGGLAAPLVAAGLGSVMGGIGLGGTAAAGYLGAMAGSSVLVGGLFGSYGAKMAGNTMRKYAKEVEDFAFLPLHTKESPGKTDVTKSKLSVTVGISGWLVAPEDTTLPWGVLEPSSDSYALRYEVEALMALGTVLGNYLLSAAFSYAKKEIISRTVFASLMVALWPIGLLKVSRMLDNPWRIAFVRSQKAGIVLADALCERVQGNRPVTLLGYSLGSRVIYDCCKELVKRQKFGIIENVVLMGAPTPADTSDWSAIRAICSGRVVNVYSEKDYILGFLYRTASVQFGIAGLQKIDAFGVENVDVGDLVEGHLRYRYLVGKILRDRVGLEGIDGEAIRVQDRKLANLIQEENQADEGSKDQSEVMYEAVDAPDTTSSANLKHES
ncbi:protein of unknown function [Taphrina deformans PYCC 5710]|uniref:DUF726 domain protein n=1 Tax=Taphrina deformans (strain PYCC 5710 / ATCC 11124 / CBS 356.35 / IMI 108563 / JCM 9778 / NBRC 8474) TaxID=1097556 RepID=R4XE15_TAPDE|nr:protein of unknown function [Taphrina deformans PYCC 5710]|eukprot:CCG83907.1 protein of unknown function [Taphrina deformans PYCC 5710]